MDYDKLIEQLKKSADFEDYPVVASFAAIIEKKYLREAATALSTLQDENEKLRDELEQVKQERDAIEQDFRAFAKQWWEEDSGFPCRWCKFENAGSCEWKVKCQSEEKICAGRAFEWRGKKEG